MTMAKMNSNLPSLYISTNTDLMRLMECGTPTMPIESISSNTRKWRGLSIPGEKNKKSPETVRQLLSYTIKIKMH